MNRLGWFIVSIIFAVGVLIFWSTERHEHDEAVAPKTGEMVTASADTVLQSPLSLPVPTVPAEQLVDTWHQSRDHGARVHQAIDIAAPMATPVVAAMPGRIEKLFTSAAGGTTAYIRSENGRWVTYYAHLAGYVAGLAEGQEVAAGQPIGFVGDTGNAGRGNTHLHFALHRMQPGESWHQGTPVNPYPYLARKPAAR